MDGTGTQLLFNQGGMESASSSDETGPASHINSDSDDAAELAPAVVIYEGRSDHAGPDTFCITIAESPGADSDPDSE